MVLEEFCSTSPCPLSRGRADHLPRCHPYLREWGAAGYVDAATCHRLQCCRPFLREGGLSAKRLEPDDITYSAAIPACDEEEEKPSAVLAPDGIAYSVAITVCEEGGQSAAVLELDSISFSAAIPACEKGEHGEEAAALEQDNVITCSAAVTDRLPSYLREVLGMSGAVAKGPGALARLQFFCCQKGDASGKFVGHYDLNTSDCPVLLPQDGRCFWHALACFKNASHQPPLQHR